MIFEHKPLAAGLHLVATPIGNARDITLRALDVLASADVLAAEDTRVLRKLLEIHGVPLSGRPLLSYHDHSTGRDRDRLIAMIAEGKSVAYASDAGTPLLADPGYALSRDVIAAGHQIWAVPGASALLAGLTVSGLPSDRILFLGFPPQRAETRTKLFTMLKTLEATVVFYESPRRVQQTLANLCETVGGAREVVLCRELTKRFEEVMRGTISELVATLEERPLKGECVLLLGHPITEEVDQGDVETALREALQTMRLKDAATAVAGSFSLPRREVYQMALKMGKPT